LDKQKNVETSFGNGNGRDDGEVDAELTRSRVRNLLMEIQLNWKT